MNINYIVFELNYKYYLYISFKDNTTFYSSLCLANELAKMLKKFCQFTCKTYSRPEN